MLNQTIPPRGMKIVPDLDGYTLMLKHPVNEGTDTVTAIARVGFFELPGDTPGDCQARTLHYAQCLAMAFLMLHQLDEIIEHDQPESWSDDTIGVEHANRWKATLRVFCLAQGDFKGAASPQLVAHPVPDDDGV
jgi:hypothetical protein